MGQSSCTNLEIEAYSEDSRYHARVIELLGMYRTAGLVLATPLVLLPLVLLVRGKRIHDVDEILDKDMSPNFESYGEL